MVALLLIVVLVQVGGLRGDVANASSEARAATTAAERAAATLADVRTAVDELGAELAALPRSGVVPTDSSGLILERMTEIRDQIADLSDRIDAICRNAPVSLC